MEHELDRGTGVALVGVFFCLNILEETPSKVVTLLKVMYVI